MEIHISILTILVLFISMISYKKDNTLNTKLLVTPDEKYGKITLDSSPGYSNRNQASLASILKQVVIILQ